MTYFSSRNIISQRFHVDNDDNESVIGYDMIIGQYLMVQLGLTTKLEQQVLFSDNDVVLMKDPGNLPVQPNLTKRKIHEVVM